MNPSQVLLLTTSAMEGFRVTRYWGLARGIAVRTPTLMQEMGVFDDSFVGGGESNAHGEMTEQARFQATERMQKHAFGMGANVVLGARYVISELPQGATQVLCYGTAASVERIASPTEEAR